MTSRLILPARHSGSAAAMTSRCQLGRNAADRGREPKTPGGGRQLLQVRPGVGQARREKRLMPGRRICR